MPDLREPPEGMGRPVPVLKIPVGTPLREVERQVIEATLKLTSNNVSSAAKMLGIDRSTLYYKMKEFGLGR